MKSALYFLILVLPINALAQSGISWDQGTNIASNSYSNMHPRMALNTAGNPLVIWGRMSDQSVYFSRWNATGFTTPIKLNGSLTIASATWMGSDIASFGDTVYVVMKQTPEADTASHIYIAYSYNGGQTFSTPARVDNIGDSISRFPTVTTDDIGNPIVAFMKFNSSFLDSRWVVSRSSDHGKTFSVDVKASGWGNSAEVCDCCPGALVSSANTCTMLYRNNKSNIRDSWMGISYDNGNTFAAGSNIDGNNWMLMSCPSTGPDGIVIGDSIYSVFCNGASGKYLSYLSKASLSSSVWSSTKGLTSAISGLSQQNYPRIAANGSAVGIAWKQTVSGSAQLPILFTNNIANGFPVTYDTVDLDNITNTDIAIGNGTVHVIWEDDNSGTVKYRKGIFTPLTTGTVEAISEIPFELYPNPVSDIIQIKWGVNEIFSVEIVNEVGQLIYHSVVPDNHLQLKIYDFKAGLYFIRLKTQNNVVTRRMIIQH